MSTQFDGRDDHIQGVIGDVAIYDNAVSDKEMIGALLGDTEDLLWGHNISINNRTIKCNHCGKSEEVPKLLEMTRGDRRALYKMYLLKEFKTSSCDITGNAISQEDVIMADHANRKLRRLNGQVASVDTYTANKTTDRDDEDIVERSLLSRIKSRLI